jgi:hypothetical protein
MFVYLPIFLLGFSYGWWPVPKPRGRFYNGLGICPCMEISRAKDLGSFAAFRGCDKDGFNILELALLKAI